MLLYRAYLLKEGLRPGFRLDYDQATHALDRWLGRETRIDSSVQLGRRICRHRASVLSAIEHVLSNGRIESDNTKIRLITRSVIPPPVRYKSPSSLVRRAG